MLTFTASSETVQISVPHHCSMFDSQPRRQNLREVTPVQHTRADDRDRSDQGLPATRIPVGVVVEPAATGVEQDAVVGIDCIVTGVGLEIGRRQRVEDRDGEIDRIAVRSRAGGIEVADRVVGRVDRGIEDEGLCRASLAPGREQNANGFICTCKSTTPHLTPPSGTAAGAPQAGASAVRRTRRTLRALAISTPCISASPSSTPRNWPWSISTPKTRGDTAWPMSSPAYTTP